MRVLFINSVCGIRSTGRICTDLAMEFELRGDEVKIAYGREDVPEQFEKYAVRIGSNLDVKLHGLRTRLMDEHGLGSCAATKRFLTWAESYDPELLWIHNIHGYYINYEMLFSWIKTRPNMEVRWTLHDCWAFTGHCSYFTMIKCEQWKSHCSQCAQKTRYPSSVLRDNCKENFNRKQVAFTSVKNMTLITPSQWLADLVKRSFLKEYQVEVCYNTIDTNVFTPTPSDFRERYGLQSKRIALGVANVWDERKGLPDLLKLADLLENKWRVVIVGLDRKQLAVLPPKVIGIGRTNSTKELAEIYTAADVFLNPTYEDNYPTVILEAEACGTRVITYDTGGCREGVKREDSVIVAVGDIEALKRECEKDGK